MMQGIRDRAHGWLAWVVVILISIPFALWGINQYLGNDPNIAVAEVNGTEVPLPEFQRTLEERRRVPDPVTGLPMGSVVEADKFKAQVLEGMIDDEVLMQANDEDGLYVSDQQLAIAIQTQQPFQSNGRFSHDAYEQWLFGQGYSPGRFEYVYRRSLLAGQSFAGIAGSAIVTRDEVARTLALLDQKRTFSRLTVDHKAYLDGETSSAELETFYAEHKDRFTIPENVDVAYVELSRDDVARQVKVDEAALRERYDNQKASYQKPERRRASHILVQVLDDATADDVAKARAKAEDIAAKLASGEDFAKLAREFSEDSGSAEQGGDLGWFGANEMDPEFEKSAFALKKGQTSGLVRSGFGFHIIRVTDIEAGSTEPFEAVRDRLRRDIQAERAERIFVDQAEEMQRIAFEQPDSLDGIVDAIGVAVKNYTGLPRSGAGATGIFADPKLLEAVYEPAVLDDGLNSEAVDLGGDRLVVVRVNAHHPRRLPALDEIRDEVEQAARQERAREMVRSKGQELVSALRSGKSPEDAAATAGREWAKNETAQRAVGNTDAVVKAVFRMPKPAGEEVGYDGVQLPDGDFVVIALKGVSKPDENSVEKEQAVAVRSALGRGLGNEEYRALVKSLRREAKVKTFQERL